MCGRFAMTESEEKIMNDFQIQHSELLLEPRYNISPSHDVPVIVQQEGMRRLETRQWGLIPFWAKTPKPMINARAAAASATPATSTNTASTTAPDVLALSLLQFNIK